MDDIVAELKAFAREFDVKIIISSAPPLIEVQKQRIKDHMNDPYRFVDYIGLIRP